MYSSQTHRKKEKINVKECVMLSNMLLFPLRIREDMIYKDPHEVDVELFVDGFLFSFLLLFVCVCISGRKKAKGKKL